MNNKGFEQLNTSAYSGTSKLRRLLSRLSPLRNFPFLASKKRIKDQEDMWNDK